MCISVLVIKGHIQSHSTAMHLCMKLAQQLVPEGCRVLLVSTGVEYVGFGFSTAFVEAQ